MRTRTLSAWWCAWICLSPCLPISTAYADAVYKVIDAQGRVTYTNQAPASRNSRRIEVDTTNVVPAVKPPAAALPTQSNSDALEEKLLRERIATERARQEAYQADAARQRAEAERLAAARAECERQRWTRCDDPDFLIEQGWIVPSRIRPQRERPTADAIAPPSNRPAPMLPGAIPHQAPADQYTPRAYPPVPKGTPGYP